jgi:hypothetical protein
MDTQLLMENFRRMGARVKVHAGAVNRVAIDIGHDSRGEFFDVALRGGVAVNAIDVRPNQRHLLLMAQDEDRSGLPVGKSQRFLCGHDERAWFVAAVPEGRRASNVAMAMDALKPDLVQAAEARSRLPFHKRHQRHNAAWVRQGEWFFVPVTKRADSRLALRNEPLQRSGRSKPHMAEFCVREGGETVYVHRSTQEVMQAHEFWRMVRRDRMAGNNYLQRKQNMRVFVRGRITHADHKTIVLHDWHEVAMNTENQSIAMKFVAFID